MTDWCTDRFSRGLTWVSAIVLISSGRAEPPLATYIFPAGAQRGTEIQARIGGLYFHGKAAFHLNDPDIEVSRAIREIPTTWFESPLITRPASQKAEDYPKDHGADLRIEAQAPLGIRTWYCETDQGTTPDQRFVIGDLPEITEHEIEGRAIPEPVELPITINGRIFPREDVDIWTVQASAGEVITCRVNSQRLGYPLEAVMEVHDPKGRPVPTKTTLVGGDPELTFAVITGGEYQIHIMDANFSGLQNYVYRLSLTRGHRLIDHFPLGGAAGSTITLEATLSDGSLIERPVTLPQSSGTLPVLVGTHHQLIPFHVTPPTTTLFHGRIDQPGKHEIWPLEARKGETLVASVIAHQVHSRLDSLLVLMDADHNVLAENDDRSGTDPDSFLSFSIPKDGIYHLKVQDRFASRGGRDYGYLLATQRRSADFQIDASPLPLNLARPSPSDLELDPPPPAPSLAVTLQRFGGFEGPIQLEVSGLPDGVAVDGLRIEAKKTGTSLKFLTQPDTPFGTSELFITAKAIPPQGEAITRSIGHPIRISVVPKTPFKHVGYYRITNEQPAGSVLVRDYQIERQDGFDGSIRVSLADRSVRHLQGVHGPVVEIPAGETRFDYPVHFGTTMEMNRTCRMQLMLVAEIDGKTVSYTTPNVNDQIIAVTAESLLSVSTSPRSVEVTPGTRKAIPIRVGRNIKLSQRAVTVSARIPPHFTGVSADPVVIEPGQASADLIVALDANASGPFNMPLPLIANATDASGLPHAAVGSVELVLPEQGSE